MQTAGLPDATLVALAAAMLAVFLFVVLVLVDVIRAGLGVLP
jgi:hypothetical protein